MDFSETRRPRWIRPPRWCSGGSCDNWGADQTPGPRPVTLSSEGRPAAGRQRIFVGASSLCRRMFSGLWVPLREHTGPAPCSHLSRLVPGPRGGRGHKCRAPSRACSVSNATLTIRVVPGWHVRGVPSATEVAVHAWLVVRFIKGRRAATTP